MVYIDSGGDTVFDRCGDTAVDRFYIALFSAVEQTHCARM